MRKVILLMVVLCVSLTTFAQRTVTGKVVEQDTNEAVIQATAALLTGEKVVANAVTNTSGAFSIKAPREGSYTLKITYVGFKTYSKTITLKDGKVAIMNVGQASGENRITKAIKNALQSPLINANDVRGAKRILLQLYCSKDNAILTQETDQVHEFIQEVGEDVEVQWGISLDDTLGDAVRVTIIATGYEVSDIPSLQEVAGKTTIDEAIKKQYEDNGERLKVKEEEVKVEEPIGASEHTDISPEPKEEPRERTITMDVDGIEIVIEDEEEESKVDSRESKEEPRQERRGLFGWRR